MDITLSKSGKAPTQKTVTALLFFLDVAGGRVLFANPDGSDLKTIVEEGRKLPDGLVVDSVAGHMYWTMGNSKANDGSILRSDLDGKNMTTVVPPGGHAHSEATPARESRAASSTGATGRAWARRERTSMAQISRPSSIRAKAIPVRAGTPGKGASVLRWTSLEANSTGVRRGPIKRARVASSVRISRSPRPEPSEPRRHRTPV
jgi:hypothetical protein